MTGKVPFGGEGYGEIIVKHITSAVPSPRSINPLLSRAVEAIILRALAKQREQRFQSMEEFGAALLDPEAYLAHAPPLNATLLSTPSASVVEPSAPGSTAYLDGQGNVPEALDSAPEAGKPDLGARAGHLPTTFRHATGEVIIEDERYTPVKPRRSGLALSVVAAIAVAGLAAYYFTQRGPAEPPPVVATVAPPVVEVRKVRLNFSSDPTGAAVLRKDTNQQLGITPFNIDLPAGQVPIDFLFRKDAFFERVESFVPSQSGQLAVALLPEVPAAAAPEPAPRVAPKPAAKPSRSAATSRRKPSPGRSHGSHSMDEDGVLAPSF